MQLIYQMVKNRQFLIFSPSFKTFARYVNTVCDKGRIALKILNLKKMKTKNTYK